MRTGSPIPRSIGTSMLMRHRLNILVAGSLFAFSCFILARAPARLNTSRNASVPCGARVQPVCTVARQYIASQLERVWMQHVDSWQTKYCQVIKPMENSTRVWLSTLQALNAMQRHHTNQSPAQVLANSQQMDPDVFSRFETTYTCGDRVRSTQTTWIEPLSHGLRHPNALCDRGADVMDRGYLLLQHRAEVEAHRALSGTGCENRTCQAVYFDLGATTLQATDSEAGQGWFFAEYHRQGITFDRYLMWEAKQQPPSGIFKNVPKDEMHKYQYFNVPVSANLSDKSHPLNILKAICQQGDFVVFKLDIDTWSIESALVKALLDDAHALSLIDEFFYEEHVSFEPMINWWADTVRPGSTLADSYRTFHKLRQKGVRAHSWV